jgi:hypothetical protein
MKSFVLNSDHCIHWILCKGENIVEYQHIIDSMLYHVDLPFTIEDKEFYYENVPSFLKFVEKIQ